MNNNFYTPYTSLDIELQNNSKYITLGNNIPIHIDTAHAMNVHYRTQKEFDKNSNEHYSNMSQENIINSLRTLPIYPLDYCPVSFFRSGITSLDSTADKLASTFKTSSHNSIIMLLAMALQATHGRIKIPVYENWSEASSEFVLYMSGSGGRKSSLLEQLIKPFNNFVLQKTDSQISPSNKKEINNIICAEIQKELKKNILQILKSDSKNKKEQFKDITNNYETSQKEFLFEDIQLFLHKASHIKLMELLKNNGNCIRIAEAEADILEMFKDDGLRAAFLRAYSSESLLYQTTRTNLHVTRPSLHILSMVQDLFGFKLFNDPKLLSSGLLARFLPLVSSSNIENTTSSLRDFSWYENKIMSCLNIYYSQNENDEIFTLKLEPSAINTIENFRKLCEFSINTVPVDAVPFYKRAAGHALRLALGLHIFITNGIPHENPLRADTVNIAIGIVQELFSIVNNLYDPTGLRAIETANKILNKIYEIDISEQNYTIYNGLISTNIKKSVNIKTTDFNNGIKLLEKNNYLRTYFTGGSQCKILLHPYIFQQQPLSQQQITQHQGY